MNAKDAYNILSKEYPMHKVRSCLDYGKFYVFGIVPLDVDDDKRYFSGTIMPAVDNKNGTIFEYDITSDMDAYHRAKSIKVKTFFDEIV